ncbi:MAG: radical SAM protein [Candidatus Eremiobacteraeota bacterium]|nr:radical SAM protein [Candidatus Eremiobacteraeota bacterium]
MKSTGDKLNTTNRKSLLYKSKIDSGCWTINHIVGCMHGCRFPCYAYLMSKRFGRVKSYNEWIKPEIVENSRELLEKELKKLADKLDGVHLSFMTDPFMYDHKNGKIVEEIKILTLDLIKMINDYGVPVTTLSKGLYPSEVENLSKDNQYGITLVSLDARFKNRFEPYASPYRERIESLKNLSGKGHRTWVSIEPYPTPNLDPTAENIGDLLREIQFVDKIFFGRINYNRESKYFKDDINFYKKTASTVKEFCNSRGIILHIKEGMPLHEKLETKFFRL